MNDFIPVLLRIYSKLLILYPDKFQGEFGEEMQIVFRDSLHEAFQDGILPLLLVCLRELVGLPFNILREFWHEFERKDMDMVASEKTKTESIVGEEMTRWDAIVGALPFAVFGLVRIFDVSLLPHIGTYHYFAFMVFILLGLLIGFAKGFPRWAYSYLGWAMVVAYWWMGMPIYFLKSIFPSITYTQLLGWWSWTPLLLTIGIGLLFARSFNPLRQMVKGVWQDWTLLSFAIYSFTGFVMMIYDENHHPYLIAFMVASTLVITGCVWAFMKNTRTSGRIITLLLGFIVALSISWICDATWNTAAYYNLPSALPEPWYTSIPKMIAITALWSVIMFWPVLIGLVRHILNRQRPAAAA